jgi:hypothetical protein
LLNSAFIGSIEEISSTASQDGADTAISPYASPCLVDTYDACTRPTLSTIATKYYCECQVNYGSWAKNKQALIYRIAQIPSYFDPCYNASDPPEGPMSCDWDQIIADGPAISHVIINPDSGPTKKCQEDYLNLTQRLHAAPFDDLQILGYVHTSYGKRNISTVEAEIDVYYSCYSMDGIFLDEVADTCSEIPYYAQLYAFIKAKRGAATVVINPGTNSEACYLNVSDIMITFEDNYATYNKSYKPTDWQLANNATR